MNLALDENQAMIREAAESFLASASDSARVRAAIAGPDGLDADAWQQVVEMGWCGTAVPESLGGLGLGPRELALIFEQAGRYLLCAPLFSSVGLGTTLLLHAAPGQVRDDLLSAAAAGTKKLSAPLPAGEWSLAAAGVVASSAGGNWQLAGRAARVPDGQVADVLLVPAMAGSDLALFAVETGAAGLRVSAPATWDATRRMAALELGTVRAERIAIDAAGLAAALAQARLYLAAEALGGAQQCLDLTVAYTATRKQFGRAIASFQAIKHRCAEMMVRIEGLRSAVAGAAALAADAGADPADVVRECAMARALSIDTYFACAQEAIQLHGGVGFTWEFDPQLHFKRAQAASQWLGSATLLRESIAASLLDVVEAP